MGGLTITLNNGVAYLSGDRETAVFYARSVGRSLRLSAGGTGFNEDGFGQTSFNMEAKRYGICFNHTVNAENNTWTGAERFGTSHSDSLETQVKAGVFSVCSPC